MKAYRDETTGRWHTDLPDVFDLICEKLRSKEPFSFARYGDGEWNAIYGKRGANCDGHEYFPDMGAELRSSVLTHTVGARPIGLFIGLQPLTVASDRIHQINHDFPGIDWVDADCIHNASIDGRMRELFLALKGRRAVMVGPAHLQAMKQNMLIVPSKNCWLEIDNIVKAITDYVSRGSNTVVLLCASMASEVIIHRMHDNVNTFIDIGSAFDPYCGVKSRRYHHKLNLPEPEAHKP